MKLGSTSKKEILIYLTLVIVLIIVSILNNKIWKLGKNNKSEIKNITYLNSDNVVYNVPYNEKWLD